MGVSEGLKTLLLGKRKIKKRCSRGKQHLVMKD